jgi:hypothetical protein
MKYYILFYFELMGVLNVFVASHIFHILIKIYVACKVKVGLKNIFVH